MSYSTANLVLVAAGGTTGQVWVYEGTDTAATVVAAGFISDSGSRGMRIGDLLIVRQFTSAAKVAITAQSLYTMTAVTDAAGTATAVLDTGGANLVSNGTASPDANYDVVDGNLVGSLYVDTNGDETTFAEAYICTSNTTAASKWASVCNDVVLSWQAWTVVTAAATFARLVAPFTGRITAVRALAVGIITGTDKLVRTVISGVTVTSGSLTLLNGQAAATRFAATPTTANKIVAGRQIALQSGAQAASQTTVNFFVVCRRMATS